MKSALAGRGVHQAKSDNSATNFIEYEAAGQRLCAVALGKKGSDYDGWNATPMPAESIEALGDALSGACAIHRGVALPAPVALCTSKQEVAR